MSKKTAVIAALIIMTIFGIVAASGEEPKRSSEDEIRLLKAEVKMLRSTIQSRKGEIKRLQSTVQSQQQKIEQLKIQLAQTKERLDESRAATQPAPKPKKLPTGWLRSFEMGPSFRPLTELSVGRVGRLPHPKATRTVQIIDGKQMLVSVALRFSGRRNSFGREVGPYTATRKIVWLKSVKTAGLVDNKTFAMEGFYLVSGTKKYNTAAGSTKTVFVLEPVDEQRWRAAYKAWKKSPNAKPPPAAKK